ncbi:MAG: Stf0 family sulfotransferase [Pseudomonadota bacterium]
MLAIQGFRGAQREWFARYQLGDTGLKPVQQAIDASRGTWAATKLMPGHRKAAARALGISDTPQAFEDAFGQIRRVYLWREDTIAQAVSLWRATQSGIWHGSDRAKGPERPEYDFQGILKQWQAIQQWNADWAEFLDPVTHYAVSYEMLLSNPASEIARIMG